MKKRYMRPVIELEDFQITQQISSCGSMKINLTNATCVLESHNTTEEMRRLALAGFFIDGCILPVNGMDIGDGYCVMTNANVAFTS
jgi:hypothetical protein